MAYGMPASEFLALCMIMADFDLEMTALEVIGRAEEYQNTTGREIGEGRSDFRSAFYEIIWTWRPQDIGHGQMGDPQKLLARTPLKDWIGLILQYDHVWFNDEGESWSREPEDKDWPAEMRTRSTWKDSAGKRQERIVRDYLGDDLKIKFSLRFDRNFRKIFETGQYSRADIHRLFKRSRYAREIPKLWTVQKSYSRVRSMRTSR
ncbi:hypothetical protein [Methanocella arvoryzae]|uniref:Uncharacterized protein n=1 Tax=Methanocella arvoryzae (strain DSM 22066 / NBRC 105507 / MRE50) TaxID=351160 RepID=Q0W0Q3_METAR|nr:hypothetical protein [Methanocella arvoryzae]CAJ38040.1 hypothetical protein RRC311 [Methanocella arvoryzae MRE50]